MSVKSLDITTLAPSDLAAILAQVKELQTKERTVRKHAVERKRAVVQTFLDTVVTSEDTPRQQFATKEDGTPGAQGWSLGGAGYTAADGKTYTVSILIRDEATFAKKARA